MSSTDDPSTALRSTPATASIASASDTSSASWLTALGRRFLMHCLTKSVGTTAGISAFFYGYFLVLQHPMTAMTVMPSTSLDELVGLTPHSAYWAVLLSMGVYCTLWLYVSLVPALLRSRSELTFYLLGTLTLSGVGLLVFLVWPTQVPHYLADWSGHPAIALMQGVDAGGNACPSLHVAFAIYSAFWHSRILREVAAPRSMSRLNWIWCAAIVYSTLSTRQHVLLDVVCGGLLGWLIGVLQQSALPWWRRHLGTNFGGERWQLWWLGDEAR